MDIDRLKFPSGRSVGNCRRDAARLCSADSELTHSAALDRVASSNGIADGWAAAIAELRRIAPQASATADWPWELKPHGAVLMTLADLDKVIEDVFELTAFGMGMPRRWQGEPHVPYAQGLREGKEDLRKRLAECNKALCFLTRVDRRKTVSRVGTSYGLKHSAERLMLSVHGAPPNYYVSNGALIAAATHLGFVAKRDGWGPNVFLNISRQTPLFKWLALRESPHEIFDPKERRKMMELEERLAFKRAAVPRSRGMAA